MKKQIKMRMVDFITEYTEESFYNDHFIKLLGQKYEVIYSENPDFIIYGPNHETHLQYDCVRIFYTGENIKADFNIADYSIDFDFIEFEDRHLRLPLYGSLSRLKKHTQSQREKFCAFMVSNSSPHTIMRDTFFEKLSEYKKVDSGGRYKNNIGGTIGDRYGDFINAVVAKHEWLKNYKFNICFENSSSPGYLTEKLFDAFAAGCIPIYWGDTSLRCGIGLESNIQDSIKTTKSNQDSLTNNHTESNNLALYANSGGGGGSTLDSQELKDSKKMRESKQIFNSNQSIGSTNNSHINSRNNAQSTKDFKYPNYKIDTRIPKISSNLLDFRINPKAFINAHNFETLDDLVDEVKRIDNDLKAYEEMRNEPIFLDDFNPQEYYDKKVFEFLDSIVSQNPKEALRRGDSQMQYTYIQKQKRFAKLPLIHRYFKFFNTCHSTLKLIYIPRQFSKKLRKTLKKK